MLFGSFKPLEKPFGWIGRLTRVIRERDMNESINLLTAGKCFRQHQSSVPPSARSKINHRQSARLVLHMNLIGDS